MTFKELINRDRLSLAFWLMVLASVASAGLALKSITDIERNLDDIVRDNNVKIRLNHDMSEAAHVVSRVIPKLVLLHDKADIDVEALKIARARQRYDDAWAMLQTLPVGEAGQLQRGSILAASQRARKLDDEVVELARAGRDADATALLRMQAAPAAQALQDAVDARIASEEADSAAHHAAAVTGYREVRALLIGVNLFSVTLGLLFGWMSRGALAALRRTLKERDDLIAMLAHEVAQPLNNASAAIEAAMTTMATQGQPGPSAVAPLARAQSVLGHVAGSLNNTLAAARLVTQDREIAVQDCDIDTVIGLALGDLDAGTRKRVRINRIGQTRTAAMNSGLIRLALRNLLVNALNYSPALSPVEINILDSDEPLALVLEVRDQGSGIGPELLPIVFERGVRGPHAAGAPGGMGLGLFIVARVVALHRGTIEVNDNQPRGAIFRVVLPQAIFN